MTVTSAVEAQRERERWRLTAVLVGGLALMVSAGALAILLIPTTYTATSAIALRPRTAEVAPETVALQAHEYAVALDAKELGAQVLRAKNASADVDTLSVSATRDPGTGTVRLVVTARDPATAVEVANGLVEHAEAIGESDVTAQVVEVVAADQSGVTSDPPRDLYLAALLTAAALLLAGGLHLIRERFA